MNILVICLWAATCSAQDKIVIEHAQKTAVPLAVYSEPSIVPELMNRIVHDLQWGKQFVLTHKTESDFTKNLLDEDFGQGFPFVLFITGNAASIQWRLYDTTIHTMIAGKKYNTAGQFQTGVIADIIASDIWNALTHNKGPFASSLAYTKKTKKAGTTQSQLILSSYDGARSKLLFSSPTIIIAPSWNADATRPFLTVSEFTPSNVRLRAIDMAGQSKSILDGDGTFVGVSYAPQSHVVYYGKSGEIWKFEYDRASRLSKHTRVIKRDEPCSSPIVLPTHDIIYCAAGSIWCWHKDTDTHERLTTGYCVGPSFSKTNNCVVYSKRVSNSMQLFTYSLATKKETQITFDDGDKIDPSWSPCGMYIVCTYVKGKNGRIQIVDRAGLQRHFITDGKVDCGYPCWSDYVDYQVLV